eukprot:scpid89165/ scgid20882/ 
MACLNFVIPKRKAVATSSARRVQVQKNSRDWSNVLTTVLRSVRNKDYLGLFSDPHGVESIPNTPAAQSALEDWRREKRKLGYRLDELVIVDLFLVVDWQQAHQLAYSGMNAELEWNQHAYQFGDPSCGANLFRHADSAWEAAALHNMMASTAGECQTVSLVVFSCLHGKCKDTKEYGCTPTPNFDSHIGNFQPPDDLPSDMLPFRMQYVFDFDDEECRTRPQPRHCWPVAILTLSLGMSNKYYHSLKCRVGKQRARALNEQQLQQKQDQQEMDEEQQLQRRKQQRM